MVKPKLKISKLRHLRSEAIPYLREHPDQVIIASILVVVTIGSLLSSLLFYRFALSPPEPTGEATPKEIKVRVKEETLQKIDTDKKIDQKIQEKIKKAQDPFK